MARIAWISVTICVIATFFLCFRWGQFAKWSMFICGLLGLYALAVNPMRGINGRVKLAWLSLLALHLLSVASSYVVLQVNWSWAIQIVIISGIFISSSIAAERTGEPFLQSGIWRAPLYALLAVAGVHLLTVSPATTLDSMSRSFQSNEFFSDMRDTITVKGIELLGLSKQAMGCCLVVYTIIAGGSFSRRGRILLWIMVVFYLIAVNSRSALVGMCVLGVFSSIAHLKSLAIRKSLLFCALLCTTALFSKFSTNIESTMNANGRYLFPLVRSEGFWNRPFGVGIGNYYSSIYYGIWGPVYVENTYAASNPVIGGEDAGDWTDGLYPIAESDFVLVGSSFGIVGLAVYVVFGLVISARKVLGMDKGSWGTGASLLVFLYYSGLTQDHLSALYGWFFYAIGIASLCATKGDFPVGSQGRSIRGENAMGRVPGVRMGRSLVSNR